MKPLWYRGKRRELLNPRSWVRVPEAGEGCGGVLVLLGVYGNAFGLFVLGPKGVVGC